jgi:hypothetical protein
MEQADNSPPPAEIAEALSSARVPPPQPAMKREPLVIKQLVAASVDHVKTLVAILKEPSSAPQPVSTTLGKTTPFGRERMAICELLLCLMRQNDERLLHAFHESQAVLVMIDYFFQFPWNNILHGLVLHVVDTICNASSSIAVNKLLVQVHNLFLCQCRFYILLISLFSSY